MFKKSIFCINIVLLICVIELSCGSAFAQPNISGVIGTLLENSSVVISGNGFGIKTTAAPIEFLKDNIENGTVGETLSASGWGQEGSSWPKYSNVKKHSGNKSLLFDFNPATSMFLTNLWDSGAGQDKFYFTAWINLTKNDDRTRFQWKTWRFDNNGTYLVNDGPSIIHDTWWYESIGWGGSGGTQVFYDSGTSGGNLSTPSGAFVFDEWMRIEGYYQASSSGGTNDGVHWLRRLGRSGDIFSSNTLTTHGVTETNESDKWRYLRLGLAYTNLLPDETAFDMKIYYDDIYIDNTQARVEIGDAATWDECTHREIQIPTAWSNTSITITVNRGSFDPCKTYYLFVVDADGNVNTAGYPIRIVTASGEPPCPPRELELEIVQ